MTSPSAPLASQTHHTRVLELLDAFHRTMQQQLDAMLDVVQAIEHSGTASAQQRETLGQLTAWFNLQARQHHMDEERHIFPALHQSSDAHVRDTASKLQQDHNWIETHWTALEPALAGLVAEQDWMQMDDVVQRLSALCQLYKDHMLLEETIAYPAVSPLLQASNSAQILDEMQQRRARWQ